MKVTKKMYVRLTTTISGVDNPYIFLSEYDCHVSGQVILKEVDIEVELPDEMVKPQYFVPLLMDNLQAERNKLKFEYIAEDTELKQAIEDLLALPAPEATHE